MILFRPYGVNMTQTVITEMLHSELGPSASERWLNCPGSVLPARKVTGHDSIFAAEGNAAHELSEWCRVQGVDASTFRGQVLKVGKFEFTVDQEMIDGVNEFVEYCDQWPGEALYEATVHYTDWVDNGFGTLDDARLQDHVCRVTDLKYGKGVQVFANDNSQLKLYALGLYQDYRHLYLFDKFILTIHQPRLNHVDTFEISLAELLRWADEVVRPIAKLALQPGAPIVAGDHCMFCPLRAVCKTREKYVLETVLNDFSDLDSGERDMAFMTNDEIGLVLPRLANIKKWCGDIERYALAEIARGHSIRNPELGEYKLVEGRSNRAWRLPEDETAEKIMDEFEIDPNYLWKETLISPAQAEKMIGRGKLDDLISKPQGKPVLVPGTDKRPSLVIDANMEFGDLDD